MNSLVCNIQSKTKLSSRTTGLLRNLLLDTVLMDVLFAECLRRHASPCISRGQESKCFGVSFYGDKTGVPPSSAYSPAPIGEHNSRSFLELELLFPQSR